MLASISAITRGPISLDGSFYQAALYAVCAHSVGATQPGSSPEGRWLTEKKNGIVEIFRCSGAKFVSTPAYAKSGPSLDKCDDKNE